ncbi:MFS transporter [Williamsia herbipolensis]|uniref:MFS transporter n=1 Tax=Williamsia herbipolensis TaxID=1603258 RepID=UPI0005F7E7ED|nr:MFS transporter [Williamsia herbipolensis]
MIGVLSAYRTFDRPARLLMVNQFGINLGFYMLMPYLAGYLSGSLGLAAWTVGLVLGVRNFSQQGMFLLGGTLADRLGYKPLIVAGCVLRTAGFALLAFADTLPALLIASGATGLAGALFNPAVRAYLAADAGERRVEAFALFNVFYQGGMLAGPLVGIALLGVDFRLTALCAAVVFAVLTLAQLAALPQHRAHPDAARESVWRDWRAIAGNRPFVLFSVAMIGAYVLSFQVYLALPLHAENIVGQQNTSVLMAVVFVVYGGLSVAGQLRITGWFSARWGRRGGLIIGVVVLAAAFVPLLLIPTADTFGTAAAIGALLACAAVLAIGAAAVFPFEMDTIVSLARERRVGTHYGFYNTVVGIGIGILVGNLGTGALAGAAHRAGLDALLWAGLCAVGVLCATGLHLLRRAGALDIPAPAPVSAAR